MDSWLYSKNFSFDRKLSESKIYAIMNRFMSLAKRFLTASIPTTALLLAPTTCFAGAGAEYLAGVLLPLLLNEVMIAFWGVAAAFVCYYAVRMVLEAHKDEAGKDLANSFIYVLTGFAIIACAGAFASAFGVGILSPDTQTDVYPFGLNLGILSVADFIIKMSAGIFILIIVTVGLRMISTQGEEGNFDKWRKVLIANCLGVVMMLTAFFVVHAISDVNSGLLLDEMRGMALYLLTIIGFLCVVALIVAGILLIVSVDESLKDRAKRIVIGTLISLFILMVCYTLIIVFIPTTTSFSAIP